MKELAVVLVSGGVDSCVTTAIANLKYKLALLHVNYGQRTESKELDSFNKIADFYKVRDRLVCDLKWFSKIGGSSLTDKKMKIPTKSDTQTTPSTYVPFRNANLLSIAVAWAEVIGARKIFIGVVAQDAPAYPDTRPEFYKIFNTLVSIGTRPETKIEVLTPIIAMQKSEVVKLGAKLKAPLYLTWSCYKNNDLACGECESCKRRIRAFKLAKVEDLIHYA
jgi:7-cyano-7-deazaguanine synthase